MVDIFSSVWRRIKFESVLSLRPPSGGILTARTATDRNASNTRLSNYPRGMACLMLDPLSWPATLLEPAPRYSLEFDPGLWVMVHAKSLRVIGQSLQAAGVTTFELEKHGQYYAAWSDSLTDASEWISRNGLTPQVLEAGARATKAHCSLCFSLLDISRLEAKARKNRRDRFSSNTQGSSSLSQLLRTVGDQLDRMEASAFHIFWTPDSVSIVILPVGDLIIERKTMAAEELRQLCLRRRLRRTSPRVLRR